jgi:hypothetical protein
VFAPALGRCGCVFYFCREVKLLLCVPKKKKKKLRTYVLCQHRGSSDKIQSLSDKKTKVHRKSSLVRKANTVANLTLR